MPEAPDAPARQRFTRDLRRIREDREVTIAEVHEITQIATSQIQSFEAGSLYDKPAMNPVYLRAFVREYARAIGIPADAAAEHLEAALDGTYENQLAVQFLDVPPGVVERELSEASADPRQQSGEDESTEGESQGPSEEEGPEETESSVPPEAEDREEASDSEESVEPASEAREEEHFSPPDWLAEEGEAQGDPTREPPSTPAASGSSRQTSSEGTAGLEQAPFWSEYDWEAVLMGLSVLLLVALLAGLGFLYFTGSDSPSENGAPSAETTEEEKAPSSSASSDASPSPSAPPATLTLGDTLHLTVLATSKVQELRVQQDEDLRRPYWIEEGSALVFPFTRRVTVENQLDSIRLFVERYPYPTARTDSLGRVVLARSTVEAFADTLHGTPVSLSVQTDTAHIRTPPAEFEE